MLQRFDFDEHSDLRRSHAILADDLLSPTTSACLSSMLQQLRAEDLRLPFLKS
jgi:predicted ATPase